MRSSMKLAAVAAAVVLTTAVSALPASAACTRLAFSVNDYGKDGPTKDAKALLDTYIAKKMAEKGIKKYTTGKKDVKCDLFLDVILFDEHTCRAEATVCWDGAPLPKSEVAASEPAVAKPADAQPADAKPADTKPAAKPAAPKAAEVKKPADASTTGSITPKAAAPAKAAEPAKAVEKAAPAAAKAAQ